MHIDCWHSRDGVLVVDKPLGPTSHDIVQQIRSLLRMKTGHTGTLDPFATGVLPLTLGRATRLTRYLQSSDKNYLAEIRLGKTTDTLDREGKIIKETRVPAISASQARATLSRFTGEIRQQPPMFSAVKVNGKRLYRLARRNQRVERPWRTVHIYRLDLKEQNPDTWKFTVHCSSGTYIRSLAQDIGETLTCGAYLENLRRIRSGSFDLPQSVRPEQVKIHWEQAFFPLEEILTEFPRIDLDTKQAEQVSNGREVIIRHSWKGTLFRLFHDQHLIAIGQIKGDDDAIQPITVLRTPGRLRQT